jgi:O-6-methylguanine DNA methyltransferase
LTAFGSIDLVFDDLGPIQLILDPRTPSVSELPFEFPANCLDLYRAIQAYLSCPKEPLNWRPPARGTVFQERVWEALRAIPPGEVRTYGELAHYLGTGARAIASACRANPFPLITPCHRVISRTSLGGYCGFQSGPYLTMKRWLLSQEGWPEILAW